ncbi:hypothetical protein OAF47_00950 [bacterium]|jgi:hypothetical protein|nr:hypothetical protein [bacterium]
MSRNRVRELEEGIGEAISAVLSERDDKYADDDRLVHLMAKAAVAILEAPEAASSKR